MLTDYDVGIRHFVPNHEFPYRGNVETQVGRFHHRVYGGGGQGDLGNEALCG